jgi:hypothetical protein
MSVWTRALISGSCIPPPGPPNIIFTSSHAGPQNIVRVDFASVPEKWCYMLGTGWQMWSYS